MTKPAVYTMSFARIYVLYVAKAEKKGRTSAEVDEIICWLTGYAEEEMAAQIERQVDVETFLAQAPRLNPGRLLITGSICGVRVQDVRESPMREIRYIDKLIDELAKGKAMDRILRR